MFARFNHFVSFLVLAGVAGYCLVIYLMKKGLYEGRSLILEFPYATFLFMTLHGLVGSVIYCAYTSQDSSNYTLWKWLYDTEIFLKTIAYPCFVTEIWLKYGVIQPEVAWIHAIVGAIPAALFVLDNRLKKSWIDVIVYLSTVSLVIVCFQHSNKWGLIAAGTFTLGYYIQRLRVHILTIEPEIWFNYFTAAASYFSLEALTE